MLASSAMSAFPPSVRHDLPGWVLFWAELAAAPPCADALAALRRDAAARARARLTLDKLSEHPTVAAVRKRFRAAGCDPTRYRPSSEALLRRVLKGEDLPAIDPFVDVNNCLSIELAVPACVIDAAALRPPIALRVGRPREDMESMRGPFSVEAKPVLEDAEGAFGTPITDAERVRVTAGTTTVWLYAYLPEGVVTPEDAERCLAALCAAAPAVRVVACASTR